MGYQTLVGWNPCTERNNHQKCWPYQTYSSLGLRTISMFNLWGGDPLNFKHPFLFGLGSTVGDRSCLSCVAMLPEALSTKKLSNHPFLQKQKEFDCIMHQIRFLCTLQWQRDFRDKTAIDTSD